MVDNLESMDATMTREMKGSSVQSGVCDEALVNKFSEKADVQLMLPKVRLTCCRSNTSSPVRSPAEVLERAEHHYPESLLQSHLGEEAQVELEQDNATKDAEIKRKESARLQPDVKDIESSELNGGKPKHPPQPRPRKDIKPRTFLDSIAYKWSKLRRTTVAKLPVNESQTELPQRKRGRPSKSSEQFDASLLKTSNWFESSRTPRTRTSPVPRKKAGRPDKTELLQDSQFVDKLVENSSLKSMFVESFKYGTRQDKSRTNTREAALKNYTRRKLSLSSRGAILSQRKYLKRRKSILEACAKLGPTDKVDHSPEKQVLASCGDQRTLFPAAEDTSHIQEQSHTLSVVGSPTTGNVLSSRTRRETSRTTSNEPNGSVNPRTRQLRSSTAVLQTRKRGSSQKLPGNQTKMKKLSVNDSTASHLVNGKHQTDKSKETIEPLIDASACEKCRYLQSLGISNVNVVGKDKTYASVCEICVNNTARRTSEMGSKQTGKVIQTSHMSGPLQTKSHDKQLASTVEEKSPVGCLTPPASVDGSSFTLSDDPPSLYNHPVHGSSQMECALSYEDDIIQTVKGESIGDKDVHADLAGCETSGIRILRTVSLSKEQEVNTSIAEAPLESSQALLTIGDSAEGAKERLSDAMQRKERENIFKALEVSLSQRCSVQDHIGQSSQLNEFPEDSDIPRLEAYGGSTDFDDLGFSPASDHSDSLPVLVKIDTGNSFDEDEDEFEFETPSDCEPMSEEATVPQINAESVEDSIVSYSAANEYDLCKPDDQDNVLAGIVAQNEAMESSGLSETKERSQVDIQIRLEDDDEDEFEFETPDGDDKGDFPSNQSSGNTDDQFRSKTKAHTLSESDNCSQGLQQSNRNHQEGPTGKVLGRPDSPNGHHTAENKDDRLKASPSSLTPSDERSNEPLIKAVSDSGSVSQPCINHSENNLQSREEEAYGENMSGIVAQQPELNPSDHIKRKDHADKTTTLNIIDVKEDSMDCFEVHTDKSSDVQSTQPSAKDSATVSLDRSDDIPLKTKVIEEQLSSRSVCEATHQSSTIVAKALNNTVAADNYPFHIECSTHSEEVENDSAQGTTQESVLKESTNDKDKNSHPNQASVSVNLETSVEIVGKISNTCGTDLTDDDDVQIIEVTSETCKTEEATHTDVQIVEGTSKTCGTDDAIHSDVEIIEETSETCGTREATHSDVQIIEGTNKTCGTDDAIHSDVEIIEETSETCGTREATHSDVKMIDGTSKTCGTDDAILSDVEMIEGTSKICGTQEAKHSDAENDSLVSELEPSKDTQNAESEAVEEKPVGNESKHSTKQSSTLPEEECASSNPNQSGFVGDILQTVKQEVSEVLLMECEDTSLNGNTNKEETDIANSSQQGVHPVEDEEGDHQKSSVQCGDLLQNSEEMYLEVSTDTGAIDMLAVAYEETIGGYDEDAMSTASTEDNTLQYPLSDKEDLDSDVRELQHQLTTQNTEKAPSSDSTTAMPESSKSTNTKLNLISAADMPSSPAKWAVRFKKSKKPKKRSKSSHKKHGVRKHRKHSKHRREKKDENGPGSNATAVLDVPEKEREANAIPLKPSEFIDSSPKPVQQMSVVKEKCDEKDTNLNRNGTSDITNTPDVTPLPSVSSPHQLNTKDSCKRTEEATTIERTVETTSVCDIQAQGPSLPTMVIHNAGIIAGSTHSTSGPGYPTSASSDVSRSLPGASHDSTVPISSAVSQIIARQEQSKAKTAVVDKNAKQENTSEHTAPLLQNRKQPLKRTQTNYRRISTIPETSFFGAAGPKLAPNATMLGNPLFQTGIIHQNPQLPFHIVPRIGILPPGQMRFIRPPSPNPDAKCEELKKHLLKKSQPASPTLQQGLHAVPQRFLLIQNNPNSGQDASNTAVGSVGIPSNLEQTSETQVTAVTPGLFPGRVPPANQTMLGNALGPHQRILPSGTMHMPPIKSQPAQKLETPVDENLQAHRKHVHELPKMLPLTGNETVNQPSTQSHPHADHKVLVPIEMVHERDPALLRKRVLHQRIKTRSTHPEQSQVGNQVDQLARGPPGNVPVFTAPVTKEQLLAVYPNNRMIPVHDIQSHPAMNTNIILKRSPSVDLEMSNLPPGLTKHQTALLLLKELHSNPDSGRKDIIIKQLHNMHNVSAPLHNSDYSRQTMYPKGHQSMANIAQYQPTVVSPHSDLPMNALSPHFHEAGIMHSRPNSHGIKSVSPHLSDNERLPLESMSRLSRDPRPQSHDGMAHSPYLLEGQRLQRQGRISQSPNDPRAGMVTSQLPDERRMSTPDRQSHSPANSLSRGLGAVQTSCRRMSGQSSDGNSESSNRGSSDNIPVGEERPLDLTCKGNQKHAVEIKRAVNPLYLPHDGKGDHRGRSSGTYPEQQSKEPAAPNRRQETSPSLRPASSGSDQAAITSENPHAVFETERWAQHVQSNDYEPIHNRQLQPQHLRAVDLSSPRLATIEHEYNRGYDKVETPMQYIELVRSGKTNDQTGLPIARTANNRFSSTIREERRSLEKDHPVAMHVSSISPSSSTAGQISSDGNNSGVISGERHQVSTNSGYQTETSNPNLKALDKSQMQEDTAVEVQTNKRTSDSIISGKESPRETGDSTENQRIDDATRVGPSLPSDMSHCPKKRFRLAHEASLAAQADTDPSVEGTSSQYTDTKNIEDAQQGEDASNAPSQSSSGNERDQASPTSPPQRRRRGRPRGNKRIALEQKNLLEGATEQQCRFCEFRTKSRQEFRSHVNEKHFAKHITKPTRAISKSGNPEQTEIRHQTAVTNTSPNNSQDNVVVDESCEVVHMKGKSKEKEEGSAQLETYTCKLCGITESSAGPLVLHINKKHLKELGTGQCPFDDCTRTFAAVRDMKEHLNEHWILKQYACRICGIRYQVLTSLRAHLERHKQDLPNLCEVCSLSFKTPGTLLRHQKHRGHLPKS